MWHHTASIRCLTLFVALATVLPGIGQGAAEGPKGQNVILMICDGLRVEEVFAGADASIINKEKGRIDDETAFRKRWWRDSAEERRAVLMPFMWSVVARQGALFGNRFANNEVRLGNPYGVSFPGYSETLTGIADPAIDNNDHKYNPNVSVMEWLHVRDGFGGRVAAFGAWDALPFILNRPRCGFYINAAYEPVERKPVTPALEVLNRIKLNSTRYWGDGAPLDSVTFYSALEYLKVHRPRVLFVLLGETDEWAHEAHYRMYVEAANCFDRYAEELWTTVQQMPEYKDKTTLVLASDHGRGCTSDTWRSHGKLEGAQYTWVGMVGPGVPAQGEVKTSGTLTHGQIAATMAELVGQDFHSAIPATYPPIPGIGY